VKDRPDGFAVLSRDAPANVGMASLLAEVADRVGQIFAAEFKKAGFNTKAAPIYAQALIGMVTFVGQWWQEDQRMSVEEAASHISALAWMGLRHLPKQPAKVRS
jgi:beta-glucosidase-like glycosyl hydrolase